ncbi:hypothetical protein RRG08_019975 [Elysia crispata]|uniref:Uncharacterized protein n=1 Tax=Elysia crispata TaxID=231223 RepID=A0AAE1ECT6_9GAST|nr:hypothetical protein RRG08_019975 [Elysia crispata]
MSERTGHIKVDSFHRGDKENNTPYQKPTKKWRGAAFIAEIERTTHHIKKTDKSGQLSSLEIEKTTHHIRKPTKVDSFFIAEIERTTHHVRKPGQKWTTLSSRR